MRVIVGLGNPGQTYHDTRHNAGFMVIELLAERHEIHLRTRMAGPADRRPAAAIGEYANGTQPVRLVTPLTMMNESGEALRGMEVKRQDLLKPSALIITEIAHAVDFFSSTHAQNITNQIVYFGGVR